MCQHILDTSSFFYKQVIKRGRHAKEWQLQPINHPSDTRLLIDSIFACCFYRELSICQTHLGPASTCQLIKLPLACFFTKIRHANSLHQAPCVLIIDIMSTFNESAARPTLPSRFSRSSLTFLPSPLDYQTVIKWRESRMCEAHTACP
ncbi:hypothetical protein SAMN02910342_02280 [Butyrivibrio sp. INlla21]|nr:hypothetical protein SAMN02910342_02280 [Butyrivibrio sp. INlla21]